MRSQKAVTKREDEVSDTATEQASEAKDAVTQNGDGSLAKKLLIPAAAGVGTLAATYAATKAPNLIRERVMPKLEEESGEEVAKVGKQAASKLSGQGGVLGAVAGKMTGNSSGGREKTRRLPIQRWTDVAVSVPTAYRKWTEFEEFPKFMHRVVSVEEKEENLVAFEEKIWFSTRKWEAEIVENKKNDRIVWETTQGTSHNGMVSFHRLDDKLTRVMVTIDFHPSGILEKMASGMRFAKRAVQADLARFKAYAEMDEAESVEYTQAATTDASGKSDDDDDQERSNGQSANGRSREDADQSRQERAERREQRRS
jgi:uncharacterized membrane protein